MLKIILAILAIFIGFYVITDAQVAEKWTVIRVIDGDTIKAKNGNTTETIRIIGINSAELDDKRPLVKCFAEQAKKVAIEKLDGKAITLQEDKTQADRDRYQRLLRHVFINGENFGLWMIENGYANEYTYSKPYKYQKDFKDAENKASQSKKGLWGDTCG